jgi:hypothetical protein
MYLFCCTVYKLKKSTIILPALNALGSYERNTNQGLLVDSCSIFQTTFSRKTGPRAGFELPVCLAGSWKTNTGRKGRDRAGTG